MTRVARVWARLGVWIAGGTAGVPAFRPEGELRRDRVVGVLVGVLVEERHAHVELGVLRDVHPAASVSRLYWGSEHRWVDLLNASEVGDMLVRECVRSVHYRYDDSEELPGPDDAYWTEPYRFPTYVRMGPGPAAWLAKQIACYEYQACEHPEWDGSEAHALCEAMRLQILRTLPGYEAAPWGI